MRTECRAGLEGDFLALPSLSFPWNNSTGIFILRCRCWASTKLLHTALHLGHLANLSHLARLAFEKVLCDGFFFFFKCFPWRRLLIIERILFVFLHRDLPLLLHHSDMYFGQLSNFLLSKLSWKASGAVYDLCPSFLSSNQASENPSPAHGWGHTVACQLRRPLEELLKKPHFARTVQGVFPALIPTCFKCHPQLPFSCSLPLH